MSEPDGSEVVRRLKAGECIRIPRIGMPDCLWAGHDGEQLLLRLGNKGPILHDRYAEKDLVDILDARGTGVVEWIGRSEAQLPGVEERRQTGQQTLLADGGRDDTPSFSAVECKLNDCDWVGIASSMVKLYAEMEEHLKADHGYSEDEWRDARNRLQEAGAP